jgi:hypothetical protein
MVSVDREQIAGTAAACLAAARERGFRSVGVWAVSVAEVNSQSLDAYADPSRNPAHALIDMSQHSELEQMALADRLHHLSLERGQQA